MAVKVGINGFGSIGRRFLRCTLGTEVEVVAINDLWDSGTLAHLLKYDSNFGTLTNKVEAVEGAILVDGVKIALFAVKETGRVPWGQLGADIVVECTGRFRDRSEASLHMTSGGAKKVIVSAPIKGDDLTCVMGVNNHLYDPAVHHVLSNASCTTNCLAPVAKVLDENFGIASGLMNTVHAYTNDQVILDLAHKDIRRSRAAASNIIPTSTGAASAIGAVLPRLKGKLNGLAMRVPVPAVSVLDLVVQTEKPASRDEVNQAFAAAARGPLAGIMDFTTAELVSSDYKGNPHSATVDGAATMAVGNLVKVLAWYDNEWAYSMRLVDLCRMVGSRGL